jgi:hypothetical protein
MEDKGYTIKLFPTENQFSSVEIKIGLNDAIDEDMLAHVVTVMKKNIYTPPKWPFGMSCPKCGKGQIAYRQFVSKKNGQTYCMYGCSDKECKFAAWADLTTKVPREEPWYSQFMEAQAQAKKPVAGAQTPAQATARPAQGPAPIPSPVPANDPFDDESLPF